MDDKIGFTSELGEDSMVDYVGSDKVLLNGMTMNVEDPTVVPGIEDKARQIKEPEMVFREEEVKENDVEEVGNEEDPKKETQNDGNPKDEVNIEENNEEEARNGDRKEEVIIEQKNADEPEEEAGIEDNNEDPEEEVRNDENQNEELNIEENYENNPEEEVKNEEDATNAARDEGKLEAIFKKKVSKLRKKLKKKKMALRKKVKNALVSTSKPSEDGLGGNFDTEMISLPMLDNNDTPNDVGIGVVFSEQNHIVDDVDNGVALSNRLKMNDVVLEDGEKKKHEIGKLSKEENTKEELRIEGDTKNDAKAEEKLEANSKKKANKKKDKLTKKDLRGKDEVVVNNRENSESSKRKTTKDKCMGMIFMCNSKTKKDCYHYQLLGLPASKRDMVFEIYEGMKLFLFDFDLKLMYGIYEAVGPGGYNIEPKAFNSAFPSQVRFSVLEDCLPLAEEKFKKIIKDNYYSKNKFDCQLNSKQLENLCELFRVASKGSTFKQLNGSQNAEAPAFVDHGPKRHPRDRKAKGPRAEAPASVDRGPKQHPRGKKSKGPQAEAPASVGGESKQPRRKRKPEIPRSEAPIVLDRKAKRPRRSRKAETRPFVDPKPKRLQRVPREETQNILYGDSRRHTLARDHMYLGDPVTYRREVYEPPLELPPARQPLHLPLASSLLPSSEIEVYRRDQHHYRDLRPLDGNLRLQDEFDNRDYYINPLHPDGFNYRGSYLASRGHSSYHDPSSAAAQPSEYDPPSSGRPASTYHTSAAPPSDYQSYYLGYRYYR